MRHAMLFVSLLVIAVTASASPPDHKLDPAATHAAVKAMTRGPQAAVPLNNVIRTSPDNTRTALCRCGKEFTVTDKSPTYESGGTTFYLCSDACKSAAMATKPAEAMQSLATWRTKFATEKLASNVKTEAGKRTAVCGCGKTFTVTDSSPVIVENGVRMYCCSDACHDQFVKMSASQRMGTEMKVARGDVPTPAK
jgi:hypothetical protein